jgi:hypothetical protein
MKYAIIDTSAPTVYVWCALSSERQLSGGLYTSDCSLPSAVFAKRKAVIELYPPSRASTP